MKSRPHRAIPLPTIVASLLLRNRAVTAAAPSPVYLWFEPEWFEGVEGWCEYHSGPERLAQVQNHWGIARVDRTAFVDVVLKTMVPGKSAKELTQPRELPVTNNETQIRVHSGDVPVVALTTN